MPRTLSRIWGLATKEWRQLLRDRFTAALVFGVPIAQLVLFGFAIDLEVRHWPAAWVSAEGSFVEQTAKARIQQTGWLDFVAQTDQATADTLLAAGNVRFIVRWPMQSETLIARNESVPITVAIDASDPWVAQAAASAAAQLNSTIAQSANNPPTQHTRYAVTTEPRFASTTTSTRGSARWVLPGLIGVVLTLSLTLLSALCVVREVERGTWDGLRMSAATAADIMAGKLLPYFVVGVVMFAALLLLCRALFALPIVSLPLFIAAGLFMIANLALGLVLSLIARSQMQAMQLGVFFYLPSILLSGFLFPFHGMPAWARTIGEFLPLTHFLAVVRAALVRNAPQDAMQTLLIAHLPPIAGFAAAAAIIAWFLLRQR